MHLQTILHILFYVYYLCRFLYLAAVAGAVVYLALEVAPHHPNNLISLAGMAVLVLVGLLLSTQPESVSCHGHADHPCHYHRHQFCFLLHQNSKGTTTSSSSSSDSVATTSASRSRVHPYLFLELSFFFCCHGTEWFPWSLSSSND